MTKFRELPWDLVEEILCRVPATSVKRVRSTCKRWDRLFNDKTFVSKHSVKAVKQFMCLMLMSKMRVCPMSVNLDGDPPSVEVKAELSLLDPRSRNSAFQYDVPHVFHCDGLLLCTSEEPEPRIVVWNPFTGQTRWIELGGDKFRNFALGYHQDKRSNTRSYKVLSFYYGIDSEIYDFDTDSWRILDGDSVGRRACRCANQMVSFQGKTYCLASDKAKPELGKSVLTFDYSTDKFGRVPLPYQSRYSYACLSVVREEKLSVLLQQKIASNTEIWVTNKIGETNKGVSWSKVLAFDLSLNLDYSSFLFDEEKKVVTFYDRWVDANDEENSKDMVYIVGEDNNVTQVVIGVGEFDGCWPAILNYFPSLAEIEPARGKKRKRLERMEDLIEGKPTLESIDTIKNRLMLYVEAICGLAESSIPFAMSTLEVAESELHSFLEAQLARNHHSFTLVSMYRMEDLIEGKPTLESIDTIKNELKSLRREEEAIHGIAQSIPFIVSQLEKAKSELHSLLEAQLGFRILLYRPKLPTPSLESTAVITTDVVNDEDYDVSRWTGLAVLCSEPPLLPHRRKCERKEGLVALAFLLGFPKLGKDYTLRKGPKEPPFPIFFLESSSLINGEIQRTSMGFGRGDTMSVFQPNLWND
ncbi:unnamed protein product [Microthlaspi erraticum]|uniref:F-box domain-containing protein n=1 Tax=Microthlaspi erraticum TaxID=1685480 RepID=A0A6D2K438_9BRAS|nr:unnamed protein product [Microthlaspi erraticum]